MQVKQGDVLVCQCEDCNLELTVTKACEDDKCSTCSDVEVSCCGKPMTVKAGGCCCCGE